MAISVALLLTVGAYAGSAAVSLDGLVRAANSRDAATVMSRTDPPRLKRSLNRIGQKRAVKPLERLAANTYGVSIAEVMVGKLLTQERLTELLNSGKVSFASYIGERGELAQVAPSKLLRNCETNWASEPLSSHFSSEAVKSLEDINLRFEGLVGSSRDYGSECGF